MTESLKKAETPLELQEERCFREECQKWPPLKMHRVNPKEPRTRRLRGWRMLGVWAGSLAPAAPVGGLESQPGLPELGAHQIHFMANRWAKSENSDRLYFLGFKVTADNDCSHKIKRYLLLGRKAMTNLDSVFKSRDVTLPTKAHIVKAMVFPVVMYGCESWTVKKAERRRSYAFELWC